MNRSEITNRIYKTLRSLEKKLPETDTDIIALYNLISDLERDHQAEIETDLEDQALQDEAERLEGK